VPFFFRCNLALCASLVNFSTSAVLGPSHAQSVCSFMNICTNVLDAARERVASILLADWSKKDLQDLARLMRGFADDLLAWRT
jgi:hypothetical protein